MSNRIQVISSVAAGVVISAALILFLSRTSAQRGVDNNPRPAQNNARVLSPEAKTIEKPLPEAHLTSLEGQEVPQGELRHGRYLLVFLTSGCGPCLDDAEAMSRLLQNNTSPLRVYGVGVEKAEQVEGLVKQHDLKFPFLLDKDSALRQSLDVHIFPTKYLVEDGVVKKAWYGKSPDEATLRRQLALEEVK